ncbi:hypothetical protein ACHAQA_000310 [Verticillium albo-atrum]
MALLVLAGSASAQAEASPLNPCPIKCSISGPNPLNWTYFHGVGALDRCEQPMLFDTMLYTNLDDPDKHITIRACMASEISTVQDMEYKPTPFTFGSPDLEKRSSSPPQISSNCASDMHKTPNETSIYYSEWLPNDDNPVDGSNEDTAQALQALHEHLAASGNCRPSVMFAKSRQSVAGLYVGLSVDKKSAAPIVEKLIDKVQDKEFFEAGRFAMDNCWTVKPSVWRVGIVADIQGNITSVQEALSTWKEAKCLQAADYVTKVDDAEIELWSIKSSVQTNGTDVVLNGTTQHDDKTLDRRAECRAEEVFFGDDCTVLSQRCGVSLTQFKKYNSEEKDWCNKLQPKDHVCCNPGDLPDFRPKPNADGTCYSVVADHGLGCWDYADANFLTTKDIDGFNKNTWGFTGCDDLQLGQKMCLSKGEPPMPDPVSNALCGPQKPNGEARGDKELKDMNPCPLNVCCNVWGQCGMDSDFCTEAPAKNGAPGTSLKGKNGCISNCGMNITNNKEAPSTFSHIAYFEAWNQNRPCLNMDVSSIDTKKYTHVHFSFPDVTPGDFQIDTSKLQTQFDKLKKMSGIKKIVSLGGWAFSAEGDTVGILREAVLPANRGVFAANVVKFVEDNSLDGIDFDWEYPSAPDIPDIDPSSNPNEGSDYLEFLKMVKRRMGKKSVSIAAPASYWYLKQFPIKEISKVVDYIVYMTYDLHGQWDHGNKWSSPGCEGGNCLRSHVNLTETMSSLAMITKAGVSSTKVFIGIASYGRSFHMSEDDCTGPDCTYTGSRLVSDAMHGPCTDTGGYISSAEIREILWNKNVLDAREWHDDDSDSDIVVYRDREWVAWMNDKTKSSRIDLYKGLNFGGVSDWAVDLDKDYGERGIGDGNGDSDSLSGGKNCPLSKTYTDLDALADDDSVADDCKPVLAINILERMLDNSLKSYDDVDNGYDKNFAAYRRVMKTTAKESFAKYTSWWEGKYLDYFDCEVDAQGTSNGKWSGPCSDLQKHTAVVGMNIIKLELRDADGFWEDLEETTGVIEDWVYFGDFKHNTDPNDIAKECQSHQQGPVPVPCVPSLILSISGYPLLSDDFDIPDPKDIIKGVTDHLDEIRTNIAARFFDIVSGIWEGGNGDVLQVLSVPIFLMSQAIQSMSDAKEKGGEIIQQEKEALIFNIISALLFFIPFIGEFAAIVAGAATIARMMAIGGLIGNTALSIAEIVDDPSNAGMAVMALLSAGRVRKPSSFRDLGTARRSQSNVAVSKMGETFKKHDDSLQKVLRNCRKEGDKNDGKEPDGCKFKRSLSPELQPRDLFLEPHVAWVGKRANNNKGANNNCPTTEHETTTTKTVTTMTTPDVTCSGIWTQACYHYSSVMSVFTNTPDMHRWTCWATPDTSKHGLATARWGYFKKQPSRDNMPRDAQHQWDWGYEWTEEEVCEKDEWPPRMWWGAINTGKKDKKTGNIKFKGIEGQWIRLNPRSENGKAGAMWSQFCESNDGYKKKLPGVTIMNTQLHKTDAKSSVDSQVKGGTTTYTTRIEVTIPNAVFSINHWEHSKNPLPDDGLGHNPCWNSFLRPQDRGYALLTNDAWYGKNAGAQQFTAAYHNAPVQALTQGMTKSRADPNLGGLLIGARSLHSPDAIFAQAPVTTCAVATAASDDVRVCDTEPGKRSDEREVIVNEDGEEYMELRPGDLDGLDWDKYDVEYEDPAVMPAPPSAPPATEAVPTASVEYEEEMEVATPGSAIGASHAQPTTRG